MNNWKTLKRNSEQLYPYCFCLVKDQSLATDLLINSLTHMAYHYEDYLGEENDSRWKINLAKAAYQLSHQYRDEEHLDEAVFFQLPLELRSALFLKEEMDFSHDIIAEIMSLKKYEVLALIARSQDQLSFISGKELTIN